MKTFYGLLLLLLSTLSLPSQNLVPNPSFESFSACPTNSCQWFNASSWDNVNGAQTCNSSAGSPDYFHSCGNQFFSFPTTLNGAVTPLDGDAVMGLATWLSLLPNFREYLAVPLTSPLVVGQAYILSFSYTNGALDPGANYGGHGTRLGAHFSVGALSQSGASPIILTPTFESGSALFSSSWQTVTYSFVATQAWTHLTIGNFRDDANSAIQQFSPPSSFAYAYYYFDQIIVEPELPLPLETLRWEAYAQADAVYLKWETSPLAEAVAFQVERAAEGAAFEPLARQQGTVGETAFEQVDPQPLPGRSTYRLRYRDANGQVRLSPLREVVRPVAPAWTVGLLASAPGSRDLRLRGSGAEPAQIRLWDMQGRQAFTSTLPAAAESTLSLSGLPAGLYLVRIESPGLPDFIQKIWLP